MEKEIEWIIQAPAKKNVFTGAISYLQYYNIVAVNGGFDAYV